MAISQAFEERILKWAFTTDSVTRPTQWFFGLYRDGVEISPSGYKRVPVTFGVSDGEANNTTVIEFNVATVDWGVVDQVALFESLTGGDALIVADIDPAKTIATGEFLSVLVGDNVVTLDFWDSVSVTVETWAEVPAPSDIWTEVA